MRALDDNLYWTSLCYFVGVLLLGVIWWKALIVAAAAFACWYLHYGRRVVGGIGVVVLFAGLGVWIGVIPPPSQWGQLLATVRG